MWHFPLYDTLFVYIMFGNNNMNYLSFCVFGTVSYSSFNRSKMNYHKKVKLDRTIVESIKKMWIFVKNKITIPQPWPPHVPVS